MLFATALAAAGLVLSPYGPVSELGQKEAKSGLPWYGFDSQDPLLDVVRIQRMSTPSETACEDAVGAIARLSFGAPFAGLAFQEWGPWAEKDADAVKDCDDFPCKVKLSEPEVLVMKKAPEAKRMDAFLSLVSARTEKYRQNQIRLEYEFPGTPVDPWKWFDAHGFTTGGVPVGAPSTWIRKLDLHTDKMRPIRQVLDVRTVIEPLRATAWVRDTYTAHYFDGWGEWHQISCDPSTHQVTVIQSLFVDLDLMKSKNIFARLGRSKMRNGVKEQGSKYLDDQFAKLGLTVPAAAEHK